MKNSMKIFLSLLLILILSFIACSEGAIRDANIPPPSQQQPQIDTDSTSANAETDTPVAQNRVDIVYFYPETRCASCISVELRTKNLLDKNFKSHLENGELTFQSYELYDEHNEEIVKKFGAMSSQLFINTVSNNEEIIRHIPEVWMPDLLNNQIDFEQFMNQLISQQLESIH